MTQSPIDGSEDVLIDSLVQIYVGQRHLFVALLDAFSKNVADSEALSELIHSVKMRTKDPDHLRNKLVRKRILAVESGGEFHYTEENLFREVNDLAAFRILHLHTRQFGSIDYELRKIFNEYGWILFEGPIARTWDIETNEYFQTIGVETVDSQSLYTSVHYVVQLSHESPLTCEIQVRTLMEEVWGEVNHQISYPDQVASSTCKEQIKVLARVTSSCSRLVDSIFMAHHETPSP